MSKHHYVAIMAGGIGSRFWPMSRTNYPKQFLDILGTGKTLIQQTFERYSKVVPAENIYVVTSNEYINIVKKQSTLDIKKDEILLSLHMHMPAHHKRIDQHYITVHIRWEMDVYVL